MKRLHANVLEYLGHHKRLDIYYEDFQDDYAATIAKVLSFLNVRDHHVEPITRKLNHRDFRERIANFDQFADSLEGSEETQYFEDACARNC